MQTKNTAIDNVIASAISASPDLGCTGSATKKNHPAAAISSTNKARRLCKTINSPTVEVQSLYLTLPLRSIQSSLCLPSLAAPLLLLPTLPCSSCSLAPVRRGEGRGEGSSLNVER